MERWCHVLRVVGRKAAAFRNMTWNVTLNRNVGVCVHCGYSRVVMFCNEISVVLSNWRSLMSVIVYFLTGMVVLSIS